MSKRSRPSGSSGHNTYQDKITREEKRRRVDEVIKQTQTISTFFKKVNSTPSINPETFSNEPEISLSTSSKYSLGILYKFRDSGGFWS